MKVSVPDDILKATTKCLSDFSCLSDGPAGCSHRCAAETVLNTDLMFVNPMTKNAILCPYLMHYGNGYICRCPTRNYIYSTYKQ
jgi:hypothetical protein